MRGHPTGESYDTDLALATFLATQRRSLLSLAAFGGDARKRAAGKRLARRLRSEYIARISAIGGQRRRVIRRPETLLYLPKPDRVRDALYPAFQSDWMPMRKRLRQRQCLDVSWRDMSFAKAPGETLSRLSELAGFCAKKADMKLNFVDLECDDVTPYVVFAHLTKALPPIISGGRISPQVGDVITAVGLRDALRIGSIRRSSRLHGFSLSAFRMRSRTPPGTFGDEDHLLRPQYKELVADQFVNTINSWIGEHDLELIPEAEGSFTRAIGEALDNAERHGDALGEEGAEGDWSIAAFSRLSFDEANAPLLRCSVGIVSIGATVSESLSSAGPGVTRRIDDYTGRHRGVVGSRHRVEMLRSVMALQDGITRDADAARSKRGGVGFMELIEVFAELGENGRPDLPSTFTILSGRSCIRVTGDYRQGVRKEDGLRELWFNDTNEPEHPPSKEHVMTLDHAFPGVILSACFTIDPEYLRKKFDDGQSDA